MSQVSSTRKLLSASAIMASGTLISRILGMVRVMLIAFILGNGTRQVDILSIATMVPNALYILFAGGALNTVLVPQIVRAIKHDPDGGEAYTNRIMTAFLLIVGVVAIVITAATPIITMLYTDAAWRGPELASQYASLVALTYLTLPQIFFYGAFFLLAQVLNARDKFGPMMWAPIANNVISILVLSIYFVVWGNDGDKSVAFTNPQILLLGLGSTFGIAAQTLVLLPFLKRVGFKLRPRFDLKGTGLRHTFSLTKWTLGFVAVNQLTLIVVQRLASTATVDGTGAGVNVYSTAHLLWILPHSLVTTSLTTAMLSSASRLAADGDRRGVAQEMMKTARLALIFLVPSTAVFLALGLPTANLLFGLGRGSGDSVWVGWTLMAFAIGLIPFTVQFICLRTYYALEDTKTPFLLQIGIAGTNALAALALVAATGRATLVAPMLALAYSLAYLVGVFVSWRFLRRRLPDLRGDELAMHIVRLMLGALPGALLAFGLQRWLLGDGGSLWMNLLVVVAGGLLILGSTLAIGKLLRIREMRNLSTLLRARRGKASAAVGEKEADRDEDAIVEVPRVPTDYDDDPPTLIRPRALFPGDFDDDALFRKPEPATAPTPPAATPPADPGPAAHPDDAPDEPSGEWSTPVVLHAGGDAEEATEVVETGSPIGEPGMVLGVRYELVRRMLAMPSCETWLAHDQVLSRDVVAHLMSDDHPRAEALFGAAQRGAAATNSRFLRVLDVARFDDGVYVISEHSPGRTLGELLEQEPLGAKEAAYVAREVADALATMHAQGLFHERLDPEHILITRNGAVRIVGFGTAAVLEGAAGPLAWSQREQADVVALALILRASQTGRWSEDLDESAPGFALSPVWEGAFAGSIPSMQALIAALPEEDGHSALESKMGLAGRAQASRPRPAPPVADDAPAPRAQPALLVDDGPQTRVQPIVVDDALEATRDDERDDFVVERRADRPRLVLWVLVVLAVLSLVVGLLTVAIRGGRGDTASPSGSPSPSTSTAEGAPSADGSALTIATVTDFDPEADGGNDEEFPNLVGNVHDGKEDTAWTTMRYLRRPNMGGQKPGVGIVVDLGEARSVSKVSVLLQGKGNTTVELRTPKGEQASMKTQKDWTAVVAPSAAPAGTLELTPSQAVKTRYLLVYISSLPPVDGGYQAKIGEISVQGS